MRTWASLALTLAGLLATPVFAQMAPPLLMDVEPNVPPNLWEKYESLFRAVILCQAPLSTEPAEISEIATRSKQDGGALISPPRTFRINGFQVQEIHVGPDDVGHYRYRSTSIVSTPELWNTFAKDTSEAVLISPGKGPALLSISCKRQT